jgi:hypothetical protein
MPDFATVTFAVPYAARIAFGRAQRDEWIGEPTEFVVPSLSMGDVKHAATVLLNDPGGIPLRYVVHEGKLFRPFLQSVMPLPMPARRMGEHPPALTFDAAWESRQARTTLLGSPFRHGQVSHYPTAAKRGRNAAPQALADAKDRVASIVNHSVIVVDGDVFHETVTPGWKYSDSDRISLSVCIPDYHSKVGFTLIDPKFDVEQIEAALGYGQLSHSGRIDVHDADLLPATVAQDALACFGVHMLDWVGTRTLQSLHRAFVMDLYGLVGGIERAVASGASLQACRDAVRAFSAWDEFNPALPDIAGECGMGGHKAVRFLQLHDALPPGPPEPEPPSEEEAENIAGAFRP